jgi:nitroreductase
MLAEVRPPEVATARKPSYEIAPLLLERWSPRSMTGEALTDEELFPLFEAARWAPSSFNSQLWRFIVARRQNSDDFAKFVALLAPGNRAWAHNAGALVIISSRTCAGSA